MQIEYPKFGRVRQAFAVLLCCTLALGAASAHSAAKTVLVLGDSLSAGYGLTRGTGWVDLLQNRLKTHNIDASIVNASISGETTSGGAARLPALLKQYRPGLVIIELGANDGLRGLSLASVEANLNAMIETAKKSGAGALLIGMKLPPNYGSQYTAQFSSLFAKVAKHHRAALVPFFLEGVATHPELFQADRLHPTAVAQPTMLDNVWPALKPLLQR